MCRRDVSLIHSATLDTAVFGDDADTDAGDVDGLEEDLAPEPPSITGESESTPDEELLDRLPDESEVPKAVRTTFWKAVLLVKIALLALAVGAMLAYFRGEYAFAAGLLGVALLAGGRAALIVRGYDGTDDAAPADPD